MVRVAFGYRRKIDLSFSRSEGGIIGNSRRGGKKNRPQKRTGLKRLDLRCRWNETSMTRSGSVG
jgi:hypothetical protein